MDDPRAWQIGNHHLIEAVPSYAATLTASVQPGAIGGGCARTREIGPGRLAS